ncbi:MerR family transcriptional regulator [Kitasatospora sp. MMS16-BH015]|uniref:helix-turn-helix domain-containing protein n=1 Tax=Kitasatospora sp. MMS16-BH015 TaxID=2018025 RepID=UPI000CF2DB01|nr:MerR family transcriptional regulator [Kitasatospora sp. MMS16-BH015]
MSHSPGPASPDGRWSIGELAEHANVTVKTVRYYSDSGLLPEAGRSSGGHRRYGAEALERLRLIRSLRTLDLPVTEVERVLDREDALEDVIAGQLRQLGSQLAALRWREAALQLLHDCTPEERADRLRLIGAVSSPPSTDAMARFWRLVLPPRLPARLVSAIIEAAVPQPPDDPSPTQVLAFARLHALTEAARPDLCRPGPTRPYEGLHPALLYDGLAEAYALASAELAAGRPPRPGQALDCFVAAHAAAHESKDSPSFRRRLTPTLLQAVDPLMARYWNLAATVTPQETTMGSSHTWLLAALTGHPEPRDNIEAPTGS